MKSRTIGLFAAIAACNLLNVLLLVPSSCNPITPSQSQGLRADSLQMSVSLASAAKVDSPAFQVALRNVGEKDLTLNLGMMLANGRVQLPDNIRLILTDKAGKTRELHFFDKRYPGVAGRVDDYVVPLRSGSIYVLLLKLEQFWSPNTKEFEIKLKPGKYRVSAQYEGSGAKWSNKDMGSVALMDFWKGNIQSNVLQLER